MIAAFLNRLFRPTTDGRFRLGWLSTWNSKCGIAEYSRLLLEQMDRRRFDWTVLGSTNDALLGPDGAEVVRCWTDRTGSLGPLRTSLKKHRFDALVIQFNFGFLSLEGLAVIIDHCRALGTRILITFHSTADLDMGGQTVSLSQIAGALARADHILVHSQDDIRRLAGFGIAANVSLFPHGYPCQDPIDRDSARRALALPPDGLVIGAYGFLLPHKGVEQLIDAAALLRDAGTPTRLVLVNALYPIPASQDLLDRCRRRADDLGLADQVLFESRFLANESSLGALAACDAIVYAYQDTQESSSAAVRMGIAARRPVLCSPLAIFSDVAEVVRFLPGTGPAAIRDGVLALMADADGRRDLGLRQDAWLDRYSWSAVARMLQDILAADRNGGA